MNRSCNTGRLSVTGDRTAQNVQLGRATRFEVQQKAWLCCRRQRVDSANDLRGLVVGDGDSAGARYCDDFVHRSFQHTATEWPIAERSKR